jgi:hypothetical protein
MPVPPARLLPQVYVYSVDSILRLIRLCYYQAAPTLSPCDDSDESTDCDSESQPEAQVDHTDEGDNNDITKELSPVAQGTKRPLDVTLNNAMVLPKIKKKIDGSCQRMKASNFDDISKEILVMATSIFRCLIATQAPFPDNVAVETKLAKTAWHEACQIKGINVKLTPSGVKMVSRLFSMCSSSDLYHTLQSY